jgi:CHRD domain-containing protein
MKGSGKVVAELHGNALILTGEFKDVNSPVTAAHVHRAVKGLRGPAAFDVTVKKATVTGGTIEGKLTLSTSQITDLRRGWYYVKIHTEANPEGHLRGWLLP